MITTLHISNILADGCNASNPLCGVTPNFKVLGVEFDAKRIILLGVAWAICLIIAVVAVMKNMAAASWARTHGRQDDLASARTHIVTSLSALGGLVGLPIIIGAAYLVFG